MKNITKKSLCLMLGVVLCHGVAWGMENSGGRKPFRFSNPDFHFSVLFQGVAATKDCKKFLEGYRKDLDAGKIWNYKEEYNAFLDMENARSKDEKGDKIMNLITGNEGSNEDRNLFTFSVRIRDDLSYFANKKCFSLNRTLLLHDELLKKGPRFWIFKPDNSSFYSEENNSIFVFPVEVFGCLVEGEVLMASDKSYSLRDNYVHHSYDDSVNRTEEFNWNKRVELIKGVNDLDSFAETYKYLLFTEKIHNPSKEYSGLKQVLEAYEKRLKRVDSDHYECFCTKCQNEKNKDRNKEEKIKRCVEVVQCLKTIKDYLERYLRIEKVVKRQVELREDCKEKISMICVEKGNLKFV